MAGLPRSPWPWTCVFIVLIALGTAFIPFEITLIVSGLAAACVLFRRFGAVEGTWYLAILTIPLREPLSLTFHGTVSIYLPDLLLLVLFAVGLTRMGIRTIWKENRTFRFATGVLLLSAVGLYSASRLFWGVANVYRIATQIAALSAALIFVRDLAAARRTLLALAFSMTLPVLYGFYQASLPYGTDLPDWSPVHTAWDLSGQAFRRVFSTFNHTLNFAHYLVTGIGLSLGLALSCRGRGLRILLFMAAGAAAFCLLFTYSIGGLLGLAAVGTTLLFVYRSWKLIAFAVLVLVFVIILAPPALVAKAERVLSGEATTGAARLVTYQQAFMILKDNPLFGVGWGGIRGSLEGEYRLSRAAPVAFTAENYFLQRGIAVGLVGLLLYAGILILFVDNLRRCRPAARKGSEVMPLRSGIIVAAAAFFAQGQFIPATYASTNQFLWILFAIAAFLAGKCPERDEEDVVR